MSQECWCMHLHFLNNSMFWISSNNFWHLLTPTTEQVLTTSSYLKACSDVLRINCLTIISSYSCQLPIPWIYETIVKIAHLSHHIPHVIFFIKVFNAFFFLQDGRVSRYSIWSWSWEGLQCFLFINWAITKNQKLNY